MHSSADSGGHPHGTQPIHWWSRPPTILMVLLAIVAIASPAHAQDFPRVQPLQLDVNWEEALPQSPDDKAIAPGPNNAAAQQPADKPPPAPTHTGFKALVFETGSDFNAFPRRRSTWVILAIGGAAAAIAHPVDDEVTEQPESRLTRPGVLRRGEIDRLRLCPGRCGDQPVCRWPLCASACRRDPRPTRCLTSAST